MVISAGGMQASSVEGARFDNEVVEDGSAPAYMHVYIYMHAVGPWREASRRLLLLVVLR